MSSSQGANATTVSGYPFQRESIRDSSDWIRLKRESRIYNNYNASSTDNKLNEPYWMKYGNDFRLSYSFGRFKCEPCDGNAFSNVVPTQDTPPRPIGNGLTYVAYAFAGDLASDKPDLIDGPLTWGTQDNSKLTLTGYAPLLNGDFIPYFYDGALGAMDAYDNVAIYMFGFFRAPVTGSYIFTVNSDDGFQMAINPGNLVLNNPGRSTTGSGTSTPISLTAGTYYPFDALWSNGSGAVVLEFTDVTVDGQSLTNDLGIPLKECFFTYSA